MERLENSLSMEQEFSHRVFAERVQRLSYEEAQKLLVQMHKHMLYKDNTYQQLFLSQEKEIVDSLWSDRQTETESSSPRTKKD